MSRKPWKFKSAQYLSAYRHPRLCRVISGPGKKLGPLFETVVEHAGSRPHHHLRLSKVKTNPTCPPKRYFSKGDCRFNCSAALVLAFFSLHETLMTSARLLRPCCTQWPHLCRELPLSNGCQPRGSRVAVESPQKRQLKTPEPRGVLHPPLDPWSMGHGTLSGRSKRVAECIS